MLGRCSRYASYVRDVNRREHNVSNVLDNDFDANTSRLFFVQLHESRQMLVTFCLATSAKNIYYVLKMLNSFIENRYDENDMMR